MEILLLAKLEMYYIFANNKFKISAKIQKREESLSASPPQKLFVMKKCMIIQLRQQPPDHNRPRHPARRPVHPSEAGQAAYRHS